MHDASRGRFKFALTCIVGMFLSDDVNVAYDHLKDLPSVVKDGPKGGVGMLTFTNPDSKSKVLASAKDKKSSLNGEIAGFRCRLRDTAVDEDAYSGYLK